MCCRATSCARRLLRRKTFIIGYSALHHRLGPSSLLDRNWHYIESLGVGPTIVSVGQVLVKYCNKPSPYSRWIRTISLAPKVFVSCAPINPSSKEGFDDEYNRTLVNIQVRIRKPRVDAYQFLLPSALNSLAQVPHGSKWNCSAVAVRSPLSATYVCPTPSADPCKWRRFSSATREARCVAPLPLLGARPPGSSARVGLRIGRRAGRAGCRNSRCTSRCP